MNDPAMRRSRLHLRSDQALDDLARMWNPVLRGWINYYGKFYTSALYPVFRHLNRTLIWWGVEEIQKATRLQAPGGADLRPYLRGWAEYFGKGAEDLIMALVEAEIECQKLGNRRILHALAVAGTEPTNNFSGNILNLLAARSELWQQLRTDRTLVETVVAEGYVRRTIPEGSSRGSEIVSELVNGTPV